MTRFGADQPRLRSASQNLPSRIDDIVQLAAEAGETLLPWQVTFLTEGTKYDPATGKWLTRMNGVLAPRQNGKSAAMRWLILAHLYLWDSTKILTMAQNRSLALDHFRQAVDFIERVPRLAGQVKRLNRTNGQEALEIIKADGRVAKWEISAATMDGPRGKTADLLWIDELREVSQVAFAAAVPTTTARPNAQIWVTSNAGDNHSTALNQLRERALFAGEKSVGWWEWSADPSLRADDPEAWYQANGAMGHMIDEDVIRMAQTMEKPEDFLTERLCLQVSNFESPWPLNRWQEIGDAELRVKPGKPTWLAIDVTPDRRRADLVAAQADGEIISVGLVASWKSEHAINDLQVAGDVAEWARKYQARAVAFDKWTGANIASRLASVGIPVGDVSGAQFAQACDETLSAMNAYRLKHGNQDELTQAMDACAKKPMADGGWRIVRRGSSAPISAACALVMCVHHAVQPQAKVDFVAI